MIELENYEEPVLTLEEARAKIEQLRVLLAKWRPGYAERRDSGELTDDDLLLAKIDTLVAASPENLDD